MRAAILRALSRVDGRRTGAAAGVQLRLEGKEGRDSWGPRYDVARAAGVSIKTVSNVVHDYPHVRRETRERVLAAIRELDYRPNVSARGLRSGKTGVIGLAVPSLRENYFAELRMRGHPRRRAPRPQRADRADERRPHEGSCARSAAGGCTSPMACSSVR